MEERMLKDTRIKGCDERLDDISPIAELFSLASNTRSSFDQILEAQMMSNLQEMLVGPFV